MSESENELFKKFAYLLYADVQKYLNENREEYQEWLASQEYGGIYDE